MKYGPNKCNTCGVEVDYINHKCNKCRGSRSPEELSKLSVEDQIKLRFSIQKEITRLECEWSNLMEQCTHSCLTKKHLRYDRWKGEVIDDNIHSEQEDSFVWCAVCGIAFGRACQKNPKGYCEYPSTFDEEATYGCSILYCAHCKKPKSRFFDKHIKDKVSYERPPEEEIPEVNLVVTAESIAAGTRQMSGVESQRALQEQKE